MLGMPGSLPGPRPGMSGAVVSGPDQSGRSGDTSLGLPVARPLPPGARPSAQQPSEESGLRFWPPKADDQAVRHDAATPAFGVQVIRELAMHEAPPDRQTPVASSGGVRGAGAQAAPPPAGPTAPPAEPASGPAAEALRFRVSDLQRRLARGELTPDQYQQRLDELRKSSR